MRSFYGKTERPCAPLLQFYIISSLNLYRITRSLEISGASLCVDNNGILVGFIEKINPRTKELLETLYDG